MFYILLFFILAIIVFWNSKLEIQIKNLDISTEREEIINKNIEPYLGIIIFNKIQIFKVNLKKIKTKKINLGEVVERVKNLQQKKGKQEWLSEVIKSLKHFKIEIVKADLKVELGTEDAALTAISVGAIGSILGIILKKQKFEIFPLYQDKNILNIKLDCIFRLNLIHYIYKTILKGRDENERKSSNRRSYAYSNE